MTDAQNSIRIGDYTVTTFSDGIFTTSVDMMIGADKETIQKVSGKTLDEPVRLSVNSFLVEGRGVRALVDAGTSDTLGPAMGFLPANLQKAGVGLDTITHVLLTHIHPDHSNGLIDVDGTAWFPKAEVVVQEDEIKYWVDRDLSQALNERVARNMANSKRALGPYAKQTTRIGDGEFLPGIIAKKSPGHTPGHTCWIIEGGGDSLMIWGDTIHMSFLQLERPDIAWGYDFDPAMSVRSRQQVLDQVSADGTRIAGMHLDFPGFGYVKKRGGRYFIEGER